MINTNTMFAEYKDILSVENLTEILDIGLSTAYKLVRSGEIKSLKIGNSYKIPKIYLIEYVTQD